MIMQKQVHHCCYVGCRDDTPTIHLSLLNHLREQLKKRIRKYGQEKANCATEVIMFATINKIVDNVLSVEAKK